MIIDQLPLLGGDVQGTDEFPIERGTTTYKTTQAALVKTATDAAAAAQAAADEANAKGLPPGGTAGQVLTKADSSDYSASWEDPSGGGDVTADMLGIVITGNSAPVDAAEGQYVIVKNSTISGITDGLYTAAQAIPANTAIGSAYLTAVSNGGLNDVLSRSQWVRIWTNPSPTSSFAAQDVSIAGMGEFDEYRIQLSDYMTSTAPSFQLIIAGYGRGEQWCFNAVKFHYRGIITTASGVTFRDSTTYPTYGEASDGVVNNSYLVPWYVEGKKN